jgi:hypothetical protein
VLYADLPSANRLCVEPTSLEKPRVSGKQYAEGNTAPERSDQALIAHALALDCETAMVDFKSTFDTHNRGEFLEMLKDIVAMTNSGGGIIIFGLLSNGTPSGLPVDDIAALDPAKITDGFYKFTDCQFHDCRLRNVSKGTHVLWAILVGSSAVPLVFSQTGNYAEEVANRRMLSWAVASIFDTVPRASPAIRKI